LNPEVTKSKADIGKEPIYYGDFSIKWEMEGKKGRGHTHPSRGLPMRLQPRTNSRL